MFIGLRRWQAPRSVQNRLFRLLAGMGVGTVILVTMLWLPIAMRTSHDTHWLGLQA